MLVLQNVDTDSGTHPASCFSSFWVFPGVKRLGYEGNHSPGSSVKGKNEWSYTSTPLICLHGMNMGKFYVYSHYRKSWVRSPTYDGENLSAFLFVFYKRRYSAELPFRNTLFRPGGGRGSTVAKVLCYKSEGRWFDSRWCHWKFY